MKIYIATSLSNTERYRLLKKHLVKRGHTITFDWDEAGPVDHTSRMALAKRGLDDFNAVLGADAVVVIMPGGRGTHVELGAAVAAGHKVVLWDPDMAMDDPYPCVFHYMPEVVVVHTLIDVIRRLEGSRTAPDLG